MVRPSNPPPRPEPLIDDSGEQFIVEPIFNSDYKHDASFFDKNFFLPRFEHKNDGCNSYTQLSGGDLLGGATYTVFHRNPKCNFPRPSIPLKPQEYEIPISKPPSSTGIHIRYTKYHYTYEDGMSRGFSFSLEQGMYYSQRSQELVKVEYPCSENVTVAGYPAQGKLTFNVSEYEVINSAWAAQYRTSVFYPLSWYAQVWTDSGGTIEGLINIPNTVWRRERKGVVNYYFNSHGSRCIAADNETHQGLLNYLDATTFRYYNNSLNPVAKSYLKYTRNKDFTSYVRNKNIFPVEVLSMHEPRQLVISGEGTDIYGKYYTYIGHTVQVEERFYDVIPINGNVDRRPPPPLDKKDCCNEMCCPDNSNLEALLKLILKRIGSPTQVTIFDEDMDREGTQKAKKKPENLNEYLKLAVERVEITNRLVGIENYPVTVPETLIDPYQEGEFKGIFDFIPKNKERKCKTLTEVLLWQAEQDNAVLGQFHQVIQQETGNFDEDGNAEIQTAVIPNVAEALKELLLLSTQQARQSGVLVEAMFRALTEITATRTAAAKAMTVAVDIQDWLDYPTDNKVEEFKTSINIPGMQPLRGKQPEGTTDEFGYENDGATQRGLRENDPEDYQSFLQDGISRFAYEDWTGQSSLHDQMLDLLQIAAMLRAILYQRTDK